MRSGAVRRRGRDQRGFRGNHHISRPGMEKTLENTTAPRSLLSCNPISRPPSPSGSGLSACHPGLSSLESNALARCAAPRFATPALTLDTPLPLAVRSRSLIARGKSRPATFCRTSAAARIKGRPLDGDRLSNTARARTDCRPLAPPSAFSPRPLPRTV